jgi:DNA-directed RNA polymerase specialized sigma24 family protein
MSGSDEEKVHRTVERVARESYGRLVAYLSVHTHDLAGAEDALSEACLKILRLGCSRRRAIRSSISSVIKE